VNRHDPFHDPELYAAELAWNDAQRAVANADLRDAQQDVRRARAHLAALARDRSLKIAWWDELEAGHYDAVRHRATTRAECDQQEAHEAYMAELERPRPDHSKLYAAESAARKALEGVRRRVLDQVRAGADPLPPRERT
jgi:hypothetical protein